MGNMPISKEKTRELKECVREVSLALSRIEHFTESGVDPTITTWDVVRNALGKSYSECDDADIPKALEALNLFIERVKNEKR